MQYEGPVELGYVVPENNDRDQCIIWLSQLFSLVKIELNTKICLPTTYPSMAICIAIYQLVPLLEVLR